MATAFPIILKVTPTTSKSTFRETSDSQLKISLQFGFYVCLRKLERTMEDFA